MTIGDRLRDDGIDAVWDGSPMDWREYARKYIQDLAEGARVTGEGIRLAVSAAPGVTQPDHPNCWGALVMHAVRRRELEVTSEYVKMQSPSSHSRRTPLLRRTGVNQNQHDRWEGD